MINKYTFFGIRVYSVVFVGAGDGTLGGTQYRMPPLMLRTSPGSGLRNNVLNVKRLSDCCNKLYQI